MLYGELAQVFNMPAKSLELKHTIKLIQELDSEIDEIENEIKIIMDEINSSIFTISTFGSFGKKICKSGKVCGGYMFSAGGFRKQCIKLEVLLRYILPQRRAKVINPLSF